MRTRILTALCTLSILLPAAAAALDFDGDGTADPIAFENQRDGSPNELAYTYLESSTGTTVRFEFGKAKEFPALADYDGDGIADFAVVGPDYESNSSGDLLWRMKLSSQDGELSEVTFGAVGDTFLSGCSFDGDALADHAFVREGVLHVLKSSDSTELTLDLGESLSKYTCGDIDGDGSDDFIAQGALQRGPGKRKSYFLAWNLLSMEKILDVQFGSGVKTIHVIDIDGNGSKEIAYRKDRNGYGRQLVVRLDGSPFVIPLPRFQAIGIGRFSADSDADSLFLKIPRDDQFLIYPDIGNASTRSQIALPDTVTAVPSVNSAEVGPAYSSEPECDVLDEPNDGPDGFLYKPVSETQKSVVILTLRSQKMRNMRLVKNGSVLERVRRVTKGPGTRDFFRSRRLATSFPSYMTLMMDSPDGLTHCILIADPTARYD